MAKTLYEQVEEEEKLLEAVPELKQEVIEEPETVEETEDTEIDDSQDTPEEVKEEPVKVELPPSPENDPQAVARAHFEAREARRQAQEAQKKLDDYIAAQNATPKKVEDPEPNAEEEPIAHMQWQIRQTNKIAQEAMAKLSSYEQREQQTQQVTAKEQGFQTLESQFRQVAPDYDAVAAHMVNKMAESARMLSPTATPQQIQQFVKGQVLNLADQYAAQGLHPIQALYHLSKTQYDYQPQQQEQPRPVPQKPNLSVVENNKKKSAHGLTTGSSKGGTVTAQTLVDIPVYLLDQMPQEEVEAILAKSRGNR